MESTKHCQDLALGISRRRGASRETAILDAALQVLGEVGYDSLTIDAVAMRAGSSKTTIYRRWPDKSAMTCAALLAASRRHPEMPAGASCLRADLLVLVQLMAALGATEDAGTFVNLLAAARKNAAIAEAVRIGALEPRRRDCRDVIQRAIGRGELSDPALDVVLFDLVIGQIIANYVLSTDGFDEPSQKHFVDNTVLPALKTHDHASRQGSADANH